MLPISGTGAKEMLLQTHTDMREWLQYRKWGKPR